MSRRGSASISFSPAPVGAKGWVTLPALATADQIGAALNVTARTVLYWGEAGTIPTALRCGRIVRFHPMAVARAHGITVPGFDVSESNEIGETCRTPAPTRHAQGAIS